MVLLVAAMVLLICPIVVAVWAAGKLNRLDSRTRAIERTLVKWGTPPETPEPVEPSPPEAIEKPTETAPAEELRPLVTREVPAEVSVTSKPEVPVRTPKPEVPVRTSGWRRIERQFIENWVGILGAVALVAGVTFLGVYTALRLGAFARFIMVVGVSVVLAALYGVLHRREGWLTLALWLRSAAAALFLFACVGSGSTPDVGLQWVHTPGPALLLLLLGVAANLCVAFQVRVEAVASLHVVLSLIPLAIMPQHTVALVIGTGVALLAIAIAYRDRWDKHLLITLLVYSAYHFSRLARVFDDIDDPAVRWIGLACAVSVAAVTAILHYRRVYASRRVEPLPLVVHIANWAILALWLLAYVRPMYALGFTLLVVGLSAFALSRRARVIGVRWLYLCDVLTAQGFVVAAIFGFGGYAFNWLFVFAVLFLETALFLRVVMDEGERRLTTTALFVFRGAAVVLGIAGLVSAGATGTVRLWNALTLTVAGGVALAAQVYFERLPWPIGHSGREPDAPTARTARPTWLLDILIGWVLLGVFVNLADRVWMETAALILIGTILFASDRFSSRGLARGAWVAMIPVFLMSWDCLFGEAPRPAPDQLARLLPLCGLAALAIVYAPSSNSGNRPLRRVAIYILGLHVALGAYALSDPLSPLIPGVLWLCLSLVALELAVRLRRDNAGPVLHIGYAYVVGFALLFLGKVLQTQAHNGIVRVRMLIEAFAFAVGIFWWLRKPSQALRELKAWTLFQPLFLEASLLLLTTAVIIESPTQWHPVAWAVIALALLANRLSRSWEPRLRLYSLVFFWVSAFNVAAVTSVFEQPWAAWYLRPATAGLLAIALQIVYLVLAPSRLALTEIEFPRALTGLSALCRAIERRRPLWIYYPFFIGVTLFLYWRFDRSVLTLLWSAEAFTVFVLSIVHRENHLRYMALVAVGACLVRLVLYDMAQSDLGIRGIVFVGVGALMLGMNSVFNKYRSRLQ